MLPDGIIITLAMLPVDRGIRLSHISLFLVLLPLGILEGFFFLPVFSLNEVNVAIRGRIVFPAFASWWTIFFCSIYGILFVRSSSGLMTSIMCYGVFLSLTWIFWTAGAASITTSLRDYLYMCPMVPPSCYSQTDNIDAYAEIFAWVEWGVTTVLFAMVIIRGIRYLRRGDGARGSHVV